MRYSSICGLLLFFGMAPPTQAALITYSDYASWSSAVTDISTVTIPNVTAYLGIPKVSVTYDGVTFSTDRALGDPRMFSVSTAITTTIPILSTQQATVGLNHLALTFPEPITAVAFNYGSFSRFEVLNVVITDTGDRNVLLGTGDAYRTGGFYGALSTTPFRTLYLLTSPGTTINVGNVAYADAAAVPDLGHFR